MNKIIKFISAVAAVALAGQAGVCAKDYSLTSPDGKLTVTVNAGKPMTYVLSDGDRTLVGPSELNMVLDNGECLGCGDKLQRVYRRSVDETIDAQFYRKSAIRDNFNELTLKFRKYSVTFRLYDDGMAYRFVSQEKKAFNVVSEKVEFNLAPGSVCRASYANADYDSFQSQFFNSFENTYETMPVEEWDARRLAFLPVMAEAADGIKLCFMEADLLSYPGLYLSNTDAGHSLNGVFAPVPETQHQGGHNNLQMIVDTFKDHIAECAGGRAFPWRIISVSRTDVQMADNDMVYRLASPCDSDTDWSWVKPGKVAWEWWNNWYVRGEDFKAGINDATYKHFIDFASENGIEYVILDEGWAVNLQADLFQIVPEIHLPELCEYAESKGVGLILWAGYKAFERDMEKTCREYSAMGIKGFKIDFMNRDDQEMVDFYENAARMCAKYHLMADFHGAYKPTGLHRTYPNVINVEAVYGLEQAKWADHKTFDQVTYDVTIPFIRLAAGPMDYTQGAMRNGSRENFRGVYTEPMSQGTRCRQLAEYVVFDSPLNMLCDGPANYRQEPECLEFIAEIPTVWNETVGIDGKVAEFIAMARRSGSAWYVGALTNWNRRSLTLDLSFIPEGDYQIEIFRDGANADVIASDYKKIVTTLPADRKIAVEMAQGGGWCAVIRPVE